ncbi:hypothetical protein [Nostoc sp. 'Peltigera malacea cyanobiont' DB3992]|uniref:hypothetical protein n=1 Tax=Nostoc sp. 'Peltigera malacea cyanobiont' DB3992 TaxID=1206980 RepID=UPI0015D4EC11|nr:hypothetical protein [Nostoc sp. 'Peltigera malacea cyanobiont' DB3992]
MPEQFQIIDVPLDAPEADEDLGTKEKFWFRHQYLGRCLFKKARPNTGRRLGREDCSPVERIAWATPR